MNFFNIYCDAPQPGGVYFQDSASPQMEALVELHDNIMFYLVIILFGVAGIMVSIIKNYVYNKSPISNKYLNHRILTGLIGTITSALVLILIVLVFYFYPLPTLEELDILLATPGDIKVTITEVTTTEYFGDCSHKDWHWEGRGFGHDSHMVRVCDNCGCTL